MNDIIQDKDRYMTDLFNRMMARNYWDKLVKYEILSSSQNNYLYTSISKSACTQIKFILADLLRYPEKMDRSISPHNPKFSGLLPVASLPDKKESYRLLFGDDVFRFVFVRNPLERLASAFTNKLQFNFYATWEQIKKDYLENLFLSLAIKIKSNVTGITESTLDIRKNPLTFREFVYHVVEEDPYDMDRHWYFQNRAMFYDIINYHFIGRIENFNADFKYVLDNINAPADIYDFNEKQNSAVSKLSLKDLYDSELEKLVVKKYEEDFDLLKYPKYQVRSFQSLHIDESDVEAVTYYKKISSIDASDAPNKVGIIIQTKDNCAGVRNTVKSIRDRLGPGINIYIGVRGLKENVYNDLVRYYNAKVYYFEDFNIAETFNQLINKVDEPYILNLSENMIVTPGFGLQSALKILQSNDTIKIIGGSKDYILNPNKEDKSKFHQSNANIIFYDKAIGILNLLPLSYFNNQRFYIDEWDYAYCDTFGEIFLVDKKIFNEQNLWFDNKMNDLDHIILDFCLRVMDYEDIKIVESTSLNIEVNRQNPKYSGSLDMTMNNSVEFFSKWAITQFQVVDRFVQEVNMEKKYIYEYPFKYLDSLGELKDDDYLNKIDAQKIILLDKEITELKIELDNLRNSLSWKMTKPLRISFKKVI